MDQFTFYREAHRTIYREFIRGFYQDPRAEIPEKCFGTNMDFAKDNFNHVYDHLIHKGDIWGISHDDIKEAVNNMTSIFLDNITDCAFYNVAYDSYDWCMNNADVCLKMHGFEKRMQDNMFTYAADIFSVWNLLTTDNMCETDEDLINKDLAGYTRSIAQMKAMWYGFEGRKWEPTKEFEHITLKDMGHNVMQKYHEMPKGKCPFKAFFENLFHPFALPMPEFGHAHHAAHPMDPFAFLMPGIQMPSF